MSPVRLALVGFGRWGRNYVKASRDSGVAEVVQVVLRRGSRSWGDAESAGLKVIDRIEEINADAAVVATGPTAGTDIACDLLAADIPVMIEKPATVDLRSALRLLRYQDKFDGLLLINHQHLFAESFERAVEEGAKGSLCARWYGPDRRRDFPVSWDYGSHAVASILALRGRSPDSADRYIDNGGRERVLLKYGDQFDQAIVCSAYWIKVATVHDGRLIYDGYEPAEPPLTRSVRAFALAVMAGGTLDWRFGAKWAVDIARVLEARGMPA